MSGAAPAEREALELLRDLRRAQEECDVVLAGWREGVAVAIDAQAELCGAALKLLSALEPWLGGSD